MNLSASPFASGQRGVTFLCLNPRVSKNVLKSLLLKGGPLSDFNIPGTPNMAKRSASLEVTALAEVE